MNIPRELDEAAKLDGCSNVGIFLRIMLPLSSPALAVVAVMQAVAVWNGRAFTSAVCSDANCVMCRSIRAQLAAPVATPEPAKAASGQWVRTKVCNGRACWFEDRWVPAP